MPAVHPLSAVPPVRAVEPPAPGAAERAAIERARADLAADPRRFDGPVLMVVSAAPDEIVAYAASYAWRLARREPAVRRLALGTLGVRALLAAPGGGWVWQRRGDLVEDPGTWTFSAAGMVEPGRDPQAAVVREIEEELGVPAAGVAGLRAVALCTGELDATAARPWSESAAEIVFTGTLIAAPARPASAEVADLRVAATPAGLGPAEPLAATVWPALSAILADAGRLEE